MEENGFDIRKNPNGGYPEIKGSAARALGFDISGVGEDNYVLLAHFLKRENPRLTEGFNYESAIQKVEGLNIEEPKHREFLLRALAELKKIIEENPSIKERFKKSEPKEFEDNKKDLTNGYDIRKNSSGFPEIKGSAASTLGFDISGVGEDNYVLLAHFLKRENPRFNEGFNYDLAVKAAEGLNIEEPKHREFLLRALAEWKKILEENRKEETKTEPSTIPNETVKEEIKTEPSPIPNETVKEEIKTEPSPISNETIKEETRTEPNTSNTEPENKVQKGGWLSQIFHRRNGPKR